MDRDCQGIRIQIRRIEKHPVHKLHVFFYFDMGGSIKDMAITGFAHIVHKNQDENCIRIGKDTGNRIICVFLHLLCFSGLRYRDISYRIYF